MRWTARHRDGEAPSEETDGPQVQAVGGERGAPERGGVPERGVPAGRATRASSHSREQSRRRRGLAWRSRDAGAAAVGTLGSGAIVVARLVMSVAVLIALLIGLAIVLRDVNANAANTIVKGIHEGANFFAGAFTGLIAFHGHPKREITVDWGIALLAYLLVGGVIAQLIARVGHGGHRFERRHRPMPMH
jgi:hypothetical protein